MRRRYKSVWRRGVAGLLAVATVALGLSALELGVESEQHPAVAADMTGFQPGNIIDDGLFFNGAALDANSVQQFLNSKVSSCRSGYTCLKDYTETTSSISSNPMCADYIGAANESAASIITKVGQACGISQKVLLVTLQKEQGLVTDTWPSASQYRSAMGALCPDTAPCDSTASGFFKQVYTGAYLLKRYTQPAGTGAGTNYSSRFDLMYPVGQTSNVLFHPNADCGSRSVFIQNQATHALYVYTPYTPNAAALSSSYGVGDGCSAYGNRNFYSYYSDWFGSVRGFDVGTYFTAYYSANSSWLGYTVTPMICGAPNGGCYQTFQGGMVFSSTYSYATGVRNDTGFVSTWSNYGREYSALGYPTADRVDNGLKDSREYQVFQGGWILQSPSGNRVLFNDYQSTWSNWGREYGALGWPISDESCSNGVCIVQFEGGWMVKSGSSMRVVPNAVRATWSAWGQQYGTLGLPSGNPTVPGGSNYTQAFQGGVITVTNNVGAVTSTVDPWWNAVVTQTWLGSSAGMKSCTLNGGGCLQKYTNGSIVQFGSSAAAVPNNVMSFWSSWGREYGILGFPTSNPSANPSTGNYTQTFNGGTVTVTNGVANLTSTTDPWFNTILTTSWLGSSTNSKSCTLKWGMCYQSFQNGWVVSAGNVYTVPNAVRELWSNWGREYGILGFPTSNPSANPSTGNYTQTFNGGTVTVTNGVANLTSTTDPWFNTILTTSWLGSSTNSKSCTLKDGACSQAFTGGWVIQNLSGVYTVPDLVRQLWSNWGREYDVLGWPIANPSGNISSGNYSQQFQGGMITVVNGVAAR